MGQQMGQTQAVGIGGSGSGWRRAGVAVATALLFTLSASPAWAALARFDIDPAQSSMTLGITFDLTGFGLGLQPLTPQAAGADVATLDGNIWADLTATTIDLGAAPGMTSIAFGTTGNWQPFDNGTAFPVPGVTPNANYGLQNAVLNMVMVLHGLNANLASGGPKPLAGVNFALAPGVDLLNATAGRVAFTSAIGNDAGSWVGNPLAAFATNGVLLGTWDGSVLTIPIQSQFTIQVNSTSGIIPVIVTSTGQIVANVPEPTASVLLGLGLLGAWAARRRPRAA